MSSNSADVPLPSHREERRFILKLGLAFIAMIMLFVGIVALRSRERSSPFPRVKLPDGTWLSARAVTIGKTHSLDFPLSLKEVFNQRMRRETVTSTSYNNETSMKVWFTRESTKGESLTMDWFGRCEIEITDSYMISSERYTIDRRMGNSSQSSSICSDRGITDAKPLAASRTTVDRASIQADFSLLRPQVAPMTIHIYDGSNSKVATLLVPYPKIPIQPDDAWTVDALPVTRTDGNLSVTLKQVTFHRFGQQTNLQVRPQFEILHDGEPSQTWGTSVQVLDAIGNSTHYWNVKLSPLERVWKLETTASQGANGRFLPTEGGKLPSIPIPPAKQMVLQSTNQTINGTKFEVLGIGGTGPLEFTVPGSMIDIVTGEFKPGETSGGWSSSSSGKNRPKLKAQTGHPFLLTTNSHVGNDMNIIMLATDQDGNNLTVRSATQSFDLVLWHFEPRPTSTSVTFEFLVSRLRHVDFFIAPPKPDEIKHE